MAFGKMNWTYPVIINKKGEYTTHRNPGTFFRGIACHVKGKEHGIDYQAELMLRTLVRGADADTQKKHVEYLTTHKHLNAQQTIWLVGTGKITEQTALVNLLKPLASNALKIILSEYKIEPQLAGKFAHQLEKNDILELVKKGVEMNFGARNDEVANKLKGIVDLDAAVELAKKENGDAITNKALKRQLLEHALEKQLREKGLFGSIDSGKERKLVDIAWGLVRLGSSRGAENGEFLKDNGKPYLLEAYLQLAEKYASRKVGAMIIYEAGYGSGMQRAMLNVLFPSTLYPEKLKEYAELLTGEAGVKLQNATKIHVAKILVSAEAYNEINSVLARPVSEIELPDEAAYLLALARFRSMPKEVQEGIMLGLKYAVGRLLCTSFGSFLENNVRNLATAIEETFGRNGRQEKQD